MSMKTIQEMSSKMTQDRSGEQVKRMRLITPFRFSMNCTVPTSGRVSPLIGSSESLSQSRLGERKKHLAKLQVEIEKKNELLLNIDKDLVTAEANAKLQGQIDKMKAERIDLIEQLTQERIRSSKIAKMTGNSTPVSNTSEVKPTLFNELQEIACKLEDIK